MPEQIREQIQEQTRETPPTKRLALLLEYDGTHFAGWQRQANAESVQSVVESALQRLIQQECTVIGSGRTDAGVHGRGQVAHVDILESVSIPESKFARAINAYLPPTIRIRAVSFTTTDFHARFQAIRREYRYTILREYSVFRNRFAWHIRQPFDADILRSAGEIFCGKHNFTTFSKHNPDTSNYVCTVEEASWYETESGVWQFRIAADRFVYGMVRSVVGASIEAACGKRSLENITDALAAMNRKGASPLAPPEGLILWRVNYPPHLDPFSHLSLSAAQDIMIVG